jgi:hypothetical protein
MPSADPDDETPFDPAELLATLTGQPRVARSITRLVRTTVTDTVCRLLPGADGPTAPRWLWASTVFLLEAGPEWVARLDPGIAAGRTYAAAMPAALMAAIQFELAARYEAAHPDAPLRQYVFTGPAEPPVPADVLRESLDTWYQAAEIMWGHYKVPPQTVDQVRATMSRSVRAIVGEPGNEAWGGWAVLAAISAMNAHRDVLPEPGRIDAWRLPRNRDRADEAGIAFQFGRAFAITLAQGLLEVAGDQP